MEADYGGFSKSASRTKQLWCLIDAERKWLLLLSRLVINQIRSFVRRGGENSSFPAEDKEQYREVRDFDDRAIKLDVLSEWH